MLFHFLAILKTKPTNASEESHASNLRCDELEHVFLAARHYFEQNPTKT